MNKVAYIYIHHVSTDMPKEEFQKLCKTAWGTDLLLKISQVKKIMVSTDRSFHSRSIRINN